MPALYIASKARHSYNYCNDILFSSHPHEDPISSCPECCLDKTYDNIVPGEWRNALGMHDLGNNHEGGTKAV